MKHGVRPATLQILRSWYVDVELSTGKSLIWVLEIHWPDNNWVIELGLMNVRLFRGYLRSKSYVIVARIAGVLCILAAGVASVYVIVWLSNLTEPSTETGPSIFRELSQLESE